MNEQPEPDRFEQIEMFTIEVSTRCDYYRKEFDLSLEAMIGVLETIKHDLLTSYDVEFTEDEDGADN